MYVLNKQSSTSKHYHMVDFRQFHLDREMFNFYGQLTTKLIKVAYSTFIHRTKVVIKSNLKTFWNFINSERTLRQSHSAFEFNGHGVSRLYDPLNFSSNFTTLGNNFRFS